TLVVSIGASIELNGVNVGLAGSGASVVATKTINASIGDGATVTVAKKASVTATDKNLLVVVAGTAAVTDDIGAGVGFGQAKLENRVLAASVGANAQVTAAAVVVDAHATDDVYLIVVAGAKVNGTAAIAGSIALQGITGSVDATVGSGAAITAAG